jgi:hypothetical protein
MEWRLTSSAPASPSGAYWPVCAGLDAYLPWRCRHGFTLAMFIIGDLMIVIGSIAVGSSTATSIVGLALLAIGFGIDANMWRCVARPHGAHTDQPLR